MKKFLSLIYAILAGICIGIGGVAFLSIDVKIVGALFFTVGLFTICVNGFNLYTGKVGYLFDNKPSYLGFLGIVWIGNFIGTGIVGVLMRMTRVANIAQKAQALCNTKLNDSILSIFILSIFCGILMYVAVDSFKNNPHDFGKNIGLFLGVTVFILCGFEHCIANMFYFTVAGMWSGKAILYIIVMTLGNSVGGVLFPLGRKFKNKVEAAK